MPGIHILTGQHLCRNPRVVKEATTLQAAGYEVTVFAPAYREDLADEDAEIMRGGGFKLTIYCDFRPRASSRCKQLWWRFQRRVGMETCWRIGWQSAHALGYGISRLLTMVRRQPADLVIGHQEVGMWAALRLFANGFNVGVDIEDWYSEDLLPEAQAKRPVTLLKSCERRVLLHCRHVTTASHVLAAALAKRYNCPLPRVIYNAFPWAELTDSPSMEKRSDRIAAYWFSQTIGPGRGLETLFSALPSVGIPIDVYLRGACTAQSKAWLERLFPLESNHCLNILPLVSNSQLLPTMTVYDIGLALEQKTPVNRCVAVTNKILYYLLAGLAVVASDTDGQREVASQSGTAVRLFETDSPSALADALQSAVGDDQMLLKARQDARAAARVTFCWDRQIPVLLESVANALARPITVDARRRDS